MKKLTFGLVFLLGFAHFEYIDFVYAEGSTESIAPLLEDEEEELGEDDC